MNVMIYKLLVALELRVKM